MTVVHFKDGTSKEYPVGFRYDLPEMERNVGVRVDAVFRGENRVNERLDTFGERVITGFSLDKYASSVFVPPVLDVPDSFSQACGYQLVGHREKLNADCDMYVKTMGCTHVENHKEHVGLVPTRKVHHHCNSYRCGSCYFWGACVREAQRINQRLLVLAEKFGKPVEAGMISVPKRLYCASEEVIRKRTILALKKRGMMGSNLICHPMRYASVQRIEGKIHMAKFYYAHHYHFLGFLTDSYDKCRTCEHYNSWGYKSVRGQTRYGNHGGKACLKCNCDGFEAVTRRLHDVDGFVVKIFDKRVDFYKTAAYELSHAGFKIDAKRVHVSTWWGDCVGVKVAYVKRKLVCPEIACRSEFVTLRYTGGYIISKDPKSTYYESESWMPLVESGKVVWHELGVTYSGNHD